MQTIRELHRRAVLAVVPVLERVRVEDLDRPTPCAGWDLRALGEHLAGQDHGFARALGSADGTRAEDFAPLPLGPDPAAQLVAGVRAVVPVVESAVLLPEFSLRVPVEVVVSMHLVDVVAHGWDVAATLGIEQEFVVDVDVLAAALAVAEQVPDDARGPGRSFGAALTAADQEPLSRLLALLGRDPAWRAAAAGGRA